MRLKWVSLLLLGAVLGACHGSLSHSLCYFYLQPPEPSQGQPQSFVTGYLDDQPIARFDSLTRKAEPLVPWMEEAENETFLPLEWVFRADLKKVSKLDRCAGGLHTWQVTWGCELREDGRKGGFLHYGYNGWDFISFDKETLRWVAAQPQAQKVKEMWKEDPGWTEKIKVYLEKTCIEGLQRYQSYRREALEKTGWWWRCWKKLHQEKKTYSGDVPPEMVPSPSSTEDKFQLLQYVSLTIAEVYL